MANRYKHTIFISIYWCSLLLSIVTNAQKTWSLKECTDMALSKNLSINQAILNTETSHINLLQAQSNILPSLNLYDTHTLNFGFSQDPYTYQYSQKNISTNALSLSAGVTLFNGHSLLYTIRQNRQLYQAGLLDVDKLKNDITLSVLVGYIQVLMDYESVGLAIVQVSSSNIQVSQTQKFLEFGKVAELSLLQVQSQLAADKLTLVNAENQLKLDKLTLLQLMELPLEDDFEIKRIFVSNLLHEIPPESSEINKIAVGFLPQIKSSALKTKAAESSYKIAQGVGLPTLSLNAGLKTGYSSLRNANNTDSITQLTTIGYVKGDRTQPVTSLITEPVFNQQTSSITDQFKNNFGQYVGLSLTVPIFNKWVARNGIAIAKINLKTAELNELQTKNDLRKTIETIYTDQISAGKKIISVQEEFDLEERTYNDMVKKYTFGAVGATDFLIEKNNYVKAYQTLIQAKYDYMLRSKILDFYLNKPINIE